MERQGERFFLNSFQKELASKLGDEPKEGPWRGEDCKARLSVSTVMPGATCCGKKQARLSLGGERASKVSPWGHAQGGGIKGGIKKENYSL